MKRVLIALSLCCLLGLALLLGLLVMDPFGMSVAQETPLDASQKWALAAPAIVKKMNDMDLNVLGGGSAEPEYVGALAETLRADWGIAERKEALEMMEWLRSEGHRAEYDVMVAELAKTNDQRFAQMLESSAEQPERQTQLQIVRKHMPETEKKSILAWDYCRLIYLAECAYRTGRITRTEAWAFIMPAAQLLQKTFSSWEEMGSNYLIGRDFWGGSHMREFAAVKEKLCSEPDSPWMRLSWDLPLSEAGQ